MEKAVSTQLLENLLNFIELGYNLNKSIESILEYESDKKITKILTETLTYSEEHGDPIEPLISYKVVSKIEGTILKYSESPKEAINTILDNRKQSQSLEMEILKAILPTGILLSILLFLVTGTKQPILDFMEGFLSKILRGQESNADLPTYFDPTIQVVSTNISYVLLILVFFVPIYYIYNLKINPRGLKNINKIFNIRSTFDSLQFMDLMYKIHKTTGLSILKILEILSVEHPNINIRTMLSEAQIKMDDGGLFYETLQEWNFDQQIVNIIEVGERTSNTWMSLSKINNFSKIKIENYIKKINSRITFYKMLVYIMLLFVGLEIMMIVVALQQSIMGAL